MIWTDEEMRGAAVAYLYGRFRELLDAAPYRGEPLRVLLERKADDLAVLRRKAARAELPALYFGLSEYEQAYRSRAAMGDGREGRREGEAELVHLRREELRLRERRVTFPDPDREGRVLERIRALKGVDLLEELHGIREACDREEHEEPAYFRAMADRLAALRERIGRDAPSMGTIEVRLLRLAALKALEEASGASDENGEGDTGS